MTSHVIADPSEYFHILQVGKRRCATQKRWKQTGLSAFMADEVNATLSV